MSIAHKSAKGMFAHIGGSVATKLLVLVNAVLLFRIFDPYQFGLTELILSVVAVLSIFQLQGFSQAVLPDFIALRSETKDKKAAALFRSITLLSAVLSLIVFCVLFIGSSFASTYLGGSYTDTLLRFASFFFLLAPIRIAVSYIDAAYMHFKSQALYAVLEESVRFVFLCTYSFFEITGAAALLFLYLSVQYITVLTYFLKRFSLIRSAYEWSSFSASDFKTLMRKRYLWAVFVPYVGNLTSATKIWIIKFFFGTHAVGLYGFAAGILRQITTIVPVSVFMQTLLSRFRSEQIRVRKITLAMLKVQIILGAAIIPVAALCITYIVPSIFPDYIDTMSMLYVSLVAVIPAMVAVVFQPIFTSFGLQKSMFGGGVIKFISVLLVLPPVLYFGGLSMVFIESAITSCVIMFERYYRLKRYLPQHFSGRINLFTIDKHERYLLSTFLQKLPLQRMSSIAKK